MLEAGTEMMLSEEVLVSCERRRGWESEGRTVSAENSQGRSPQATLHLAHRILFFIRRLKVFLK